MTDINVEDLCRDIQMKLPDVLWMLDYTGRYRAGRFNEDFARLEDGRTYLFGVVEVPLNYTDEASFTWGVWAQVSPEDHDRYLNAFQTAEAEGLEIEGLLANDIPGYEGSEGLPVLLTTHADRRPSVTVLRGDLAEDQREGLSLEDHVELDRILFGDDEDEDEEEGPDATDR